MKRLLSILLAAVLLCGVLPLAPAAKAESGAIWTYAYLGDELTRIDLREAEGAPVLFLPSSADITSVSIFFDASDASVTLGGETFTIKSGDTLDLSSGSFSIGFGGSETEVSVKKSENIPSLFLVSADPEKDREWIEASPDHSRKAKGSMTLLDSEGKVVYSGSLSQIRGRGNTSWVKPKRPYQLKLDKKYDLLETGDSANASKTWLLLANCLDPSLIRNSLVFDWSRELGLDDTPEYRHADLWYDGEYRGSYIITEKVEVGSGRVEIEDLEDAIADQNPDYDFDAPVLMSGVTPWGTEMQYADGITDPEDITGGYLLEMEIVHRIRSEVSWFQTRHGDYVFVNSPEAVSKDALLYIAGVYQQFEDAVYNGGVDPATGKRYDEIADVDSLVRAYVAMEASGNSECFVNSTFFYKDAGDDLLHCGPMWDYDLSLSSSREALSAGAKPLGRALIQLPDFQRRVKEVYRDELYPYLRSLAEGGIDSRRDELSASAEMNYSIWPYIDYFGPSQAGEGYGVNVDFLKEYVDVRSEYLLSAFDDLCVRFSDVPKSAWFYPFVEELAERGIMNGISDFVFSPAASITRADLVTVLYRAYGEPEAGVCPFPDVAPDTYYTPAVAWAYEKGLVAGTLSGEFMPEAGITRQDLITILHRLCGLPEPGDALIEYADKGEISGYAEKAVQWANSAGFIQGDEFSLFNPKSGTTRAEAAKLVAKLLEYTDK